MNEFPEIHDPESTLRKVSVYAPYLIGWVNSFGWGQDEPITISLLHEALPDGVEAGPNGQDWQKWKLGPHQTVTITRESDNDIRKQDFVQVAGEWKIDNGSADQ